MSSTIRILRFPLIILAGAFGGVGLIVGFVFILAHLIRLKSLGSPYLLPLYPFRGLGTAEGLLRLPFSQTAGRASFLRPKRNGAMIQTKRKKNETVRKNEKYFIMLFHYHFNFSIWLYRSKYSRYTANDSRRWFRYNER